MTCTSEWRGYYDTYACGLPSGHPGRHASSALPLSVEWDDDTPWGGSWEYVWNHLNWLEYREQLTND